MKVKELQKILETKDPESNVYISPYTHRGKFMPVDNAENEDMGKDYEYDEGCNIMVPTKSEDHVSVVLYPKKDFNEV